MNKYFFPLLLLIFPLTNSFSQNIYKDIKDSVVSIEHMFFMDSSFCQKPELINELEELSEREFLNTYLPVKSGSGFIIDSQGFILTNRHVVLFKDMESARKSLGTDIAQSLLEEYGYNFEDSDKAVILQDFQSMFSQGEYRFTGILNDKEYELEVLEISEEDKEDLALVRIEVEEPFLQLELADENSINSFLIGETVFSFGYPLGLTISQIFQDRIVSVNKGNISAYRDDELGIQHNAAISKGNSGGPLVNADRKVVGINTALIESGNSLYYSIGIDRVKSFLRERGYEDILKWNKRVPADDESTDSGNLNINALGELESSSDLLILGEEGAYVYLDDRVAGIVPLYVNLTKPRSELKIIGEETEFSATLRRLTSLTGTTELISGGVKKQITLSIKDRDDQKVEVYADGRFLGVTPLQMDLPADTYSFSFKSEKYVYPDQIVDLSENDVEEIQLQGYPGYLLEILNLDKILNQNDSDSLALILGKVNTRRSVSLTFRSGDMEINSEIKDSMVLKEGSWTMNIEGVPEWENHPVYFDMKGDTILDLLKSGGSGSLTIRNFREDMKVFIDGEIVENPKETLPALPLGIRDVYIWNKGNIPYKTDITIRMDNSAFVTFQPRNSHGRKAFLWAAGGVLAAGTGLTLGLADTDPYALSHSSNYDEYVDQKERIANMSGGLIMSGVCMLIPALFEWASQKKDNREYRKLQRGVQ